MTRHFRRPHPTNGGTRTGRSKARRALPCLELLEDRTVPSSFNFTDFSNVSALNLQGAAASVNNRLRLTPAQGGLSGSAWYNVAKPLVAGNFQTTFQFQLSNGPYGPNGGSDGFTFAIQNSDPTALFGTGGDLGYSGLLNSVVIEFDTFYNDGYNDSSASSISVHTNGTGPNSANESYSLGHYDTSRFILDDGNVHTAKVSYAPGTLSICLDNLTRPVLTVSLNLDSKLNLDQARAWVGFTAATGGGYQNHDILNWSFQGDDTVIIADKPAVIEGAANTTTTANFTITRMGSLAGQAVVNWKTSDGTATAGSDYVAGSGSVTFADGEATKTVAVTVNGDNTPESDETFNLVLSTTANYAAISGLATIRNDDAAISVGAASAIEGSNTLKLLDRFVSNGSGGLARPRGSIFGPDANGDGISDLYVTSADTNAVLRFNGVTGAYIDTFVTPGSGGLKSPVDLAYGSDGNLYVTSYGSNQLLRYDGTTGDFIDVVSSSLSSPEGITLGPDGSLYIANLGTNEVLRYNTTSGLTSFVSAGSGSLSYPRKAAFGPDVIGDSAQDLYVTSEGNGKVLRFDGLTGAYIDTIVTIGTNGPNWLEFGADGSLYVSAWTSTSNNYKSILRYNATTGALLDSLALGRDGWAFLVGPGNVIYSSGVGAGPFVDRIGLASLEVFTVSLASASAATTTVSYATADGTAVSTGTNPNYTATSGTLTFAPGETSKGILVSTNNDGVADPTRSFSVTLSNPTGGVITTGQGVGTILDDTKFYVVDAGGSDNTYQYAVSGGALGNNALIGGDTAPRGVAATAAGTTEWVVDANKTVYVYSTGGTLLGSWSAGGLSSSATLTGIATNGTDIWLVDSYSAQVYQYTGAASRLSGSQSAASSFSLFTKKQGGSTNPQDIVTDGTSFWVVDGTALKVFKYTLSGSLLGSWSIDPANIHPTGITINPNNVSDIWIVDNGTNKVYQYTAAANRTSGNQNAAASFALAANNTNPQGIADPPVSGMDSVVAPATWSVIATNAPSPTDASAANTADWGWVAEATGSAGPGYANPYPDLPTSKPPQATASWDWKPATAATASTIWGGSADLLAPRDQVFAGAEPVGRRLATRRT
jgi:hypothetical protein